MSSPIKTIAAFDFDGTITSCDSFTRFALFTLGPLRFLLRSLLLLPALFTFSRSRLKERALYVYFSDLTLEEFRLKAVRFTEKKLPFLLRPKALERIAWHKSQGHTLILVTAAFEDLVRPFTEAYGFDALLGSRMELKSGRLIGPNCRGEEKVKRLLEKAGPKEGYILYAYGDSRGDRELLALANHSSFREF